jgi:hypothetical protein
MVIVGYGDYRNHTLLQILSSLLSELAERYPLCHDAQAGADYADLQITIAIHEEVLRRQKGGAVVPRAPSARELAIKVVTKGYQVLSKDHHPDRKGGTEIGQKTLNAVREQLLRACNEIEDEYPGDAVAIPAPQASPVSDEDIPF